MALQPKFEIKACLEAYEIFANETAGYPALVRKLTDDCIAKLSKCPHRFAQHYLEEWLRGYLGYLDEAMVLVTGDLLRAHQKERHKRYIQNRGHEGTYVKGQQHLLTACSKDGLDYCIRKSASGRISERLENRMDLCSNQMDERIKEMDGNVSRICKALRDMGALERDIKCDICRNKFKGEALAVTFPPQLEIKRLHLTREMLYAKFPQDLAATACPPRLKTVINDHPELADAAKAAAAEAEARSAKESLQQSRCEAAAVAAAQSEVSLDKIKAQLGVSSLLSTVSASVVHLEDDEAEEADQAALAAAATAAAVALAEGRAEAYRADSEADSDANDMYAVAQQQQSMGQPRLRPDRPAVQTRPTRDRQELPGLPLPQTRTVKVTVRLPGHREVACVSLNVELTYNAALVMEDDEEDGVDTAHVSGPSPSPAPLLAVHEDDVLQDVYWRLWGGSARLKPTPVLPVSLSLQENGPRLGPTLVLSEGAELWVRCEESAAVAGALEAMSKWAEEEGKPVRDMIPPLVLVQRLAAWLAIPGRSAASAAPAVLDLSHLGNLLVDNWETAAGMLGLCRDLVAAAAAAAPPPSSLTLPPPPLHVTADHTHIDGVLLYYLVTRCTHVSCACSGLDPQAVTDFMEVLVEGGEEDLLALLVVLDAPHNAFVFDAAAVEGEEREPYGDEEGDGGDWMDDGGGGTQGGCMYADAWGAFCEFLLVNCPDLLRLNLSHNASDARADMAVLVQGLVRGLEARYSRGLPAVAEIVLSGLERHHSVLAKVLSLQCARLSGGGHQTSLHVGGMARVIA